MKTKLLLSTLLSFSFCLLSSQIPQGFNYQAIARDGVSGNPITTVIPVRITIQSDEAGTTTFWVEVHSSVTPNSSGLFTLVVGNGARQSGVTNFSDIDWSVTPKYIKTEIYYQSEWKNLGASKLWTVPYSMVANELGGSLDKLQVEGKDTGTDDPLFEVKNKLGKTVFAVYNKAVRIYVDNSVAKGAKGGFAIGGFSTGKAPSQNFMIVNPDTIRMFIDDTGKGAKGGFAIGGFGTTKSQLDNYLKVDVDKIKAGKVDYLNITPNNTFIGSLAGSSNSTGLYNSFIGYQAGNTNSTGSYNVMFGYKAGFASTVSYNTFVGYQAGKANTTGQFNAYIGYNAGLANTIGEYNAFLGYNAGVANTDGVNNVFIGNQAGYTNTSGYNNIFIGNLAGQNADANSNSTFIGNEAGRNVIGDDNIMIGDRSGTNGFLTSHTLTGVTILGIDAGRNITGDGNTFIGYGSGSKWGSAGTGLNNTFVGSQAGGGSTTTLLDNNVCIGYMAGNEKSGSNKLYIDNSSTSSPLIGGDFSTNRVGINRMPTTYALEVGGTIWANGSTISNGATTWSDARYKTNITNFDNALFYVMKMQGVRYDWRTDEFPDLNFSEGEQIGVIAQDLEKILPELVTTNPDGYKSVSYEKLTPVLIEAVKEQQKHIASQDEKIAKLEKLVQEILTKQVAK